MFRFLKIYPDVYHSGSHLVDIVCVYTRDAVKAYHSLYAYNYFLSGKVGNIYLYNVDDICLVLGEVGVSQTVTKKSTLHGS